MNFMTYLAIANTTSCVKYHYNVFYKSDADLSVRMSHYGPQ